MNGIACANCGREIGRLETPSVWRDEAVCQACWARLTAADEPATGTETVRRPAARRTSRKAAGSLIGGAAFMLGIAIVGYFVDRPNGSAASHDDGMTPVVNTFRPRRFDAIRYSDIAQDVGRSMTVSEEKTMDGTPRCVASEPGGAVLIVTEGDKDDLRYAHIAASFTADDLWSLQPGVSLPADTPMALHANRQFGAVAAFMRDVAPEWVGGADWARGLLNKSQHTASPIHAEIVQGHKQFIFEFNDSWFAKIAVQPIN